VNAPHGRKEARELVKLLALAPGHRLHREQAMDVLWRERGPAAAANNLGISWTMRKFGLACDTLDVRRRHRRRPARSREGDREPRAAVGAPRRWRQLRHRHAVRVRAPAARAA